MGIDVDRVRRDTAGCDRRAHFNNAGAALPPRQVTDTVVEHLRLEERIGGYEAAAERHERLEHTYDALARLVGAHRDEIAVVENATRAWDMAFYALPLGPGDRILTTSSEYASNVIAFLQTARHRGVSIDVVPDDSTGQLDVDALRDMLDERVKLIAVNHVPTNNGLVNPAAEIGKAAREAGVVYLLDACQSIGQLPLDVGEIGCDLLSATGRKFLRGPRGTGFLYCSRRVLEQLEPPFLDLHAATLTSQHTYEIRDDARRFETWETNYAGKAGLGVAADYALGVGLEAIEERVAHLAGTLRRALRAVPGAEVHDTGARQCGIVMFTIAGHDSQDIKRQLADRRVNVSVASARPGQPQPWVRASVHYYNTEEEIERLCSSLPRN